MDRVRLNDVSLEDWQRNDAEHLRYDYDLQSSDVVIDVGAYRGEFSAEILRRFGCHVVAIEPTAAILGFEGAEVINKAVSTFDGRQKFGGQYLYTSLFDDRHLREFPCIDFNSVVQRFQEVALCKINIEGGEYQILPHLISAGLHQRILNLQVQFHQIEGQPYNKWYNGIAQSLRRSHDLTYFFPFCWESWRRKATRDTSHA